MRSETGSPSADDLGSRVDLVLSAPFLSSGARVLLLVLSRVGDVVDMSQPEIARRCGLTPASVSRIVGALHAIGVLEVCSPRGRGRGCITRYSVDWSRLAQKSQRRVSASFAKPGCGR